MAIDFFSTTLDPKLEKKLGTLFRKGFISSGKKSELFEKKFAKEFNIQNCTAVNSGTSSLHLALRCLDIKKGDEVILSPQTFIATGFAILYCNAKPVFADIQIDTGNICPNSIREKITSKTRAIMAVHWGGYPCDLDEINSIAKEKKIFVVEDAAHALGSSYKKRLVGEISDFTCFSFQAKKHLTTGDGGMLVSKKKNHHNQAQKLKWFGIDRNSKREFMGERIYNLRDVGYKYHLNDIASIIGIENLKTIRKKITILKQLGSTYDSGLSNIPGISLMKREDDRSSSHWLYTILVKDRPRFYKIMKKNNIPVSLVHRRIDRHKIFGGINNKLKNQKYFDKHHICLPINEKISSTEIKKIISVIRKNY